MKFSKYFAEFQYNVNENDLRICRTDTFYFTPTNELENDWEKAEQKRIMKYISRFIRKPSTDGSIYIKRFIADGFDENGVQKFKYPFVAYFCVKDGAVMIKLWLEKYNRYASGDAYGPEAAISKFMELVEIY